MGLDRRLVGRADVRKRGQRLGRSPRVSTTEKSGDNTPVIKELHARWLITAHFVEIERRLLCKPHYTSGVTRGAYW